MASRELVPHSAGAEMIYLVDGLRAIHEASEPLSPDYDFQARFEAGYLGRFTNPGPPYSVVCIDEGTEADRFATTKDKGIIHSPGSGILFLPEVASYITQFGIEAVYSHVGCGAAGLYADQRGLSKPTDDVAREGAILLSETLGCDYGGHLILTGRPLPFHPAKVVYYIDDEHVEPSREPLLPPGFEISRWAMPKDIAARDTTLAMNIAYGKHGLGSHYFSSSEKPLHLVGITTNNNAERVTRELTRIKEASKGKVPFVRTTLIRTPH